MNSSLANWVENYYSQLDTHGFAVTLNEKHVGGSYSIYLDHAEMVGAITFWPPDMYEFQFNSYKTGSVILIESERLTNVEALSTHFAQLMKEKLLPAVSIDSDDLST